MVPPLGRKQEAFNLLNHGHDRIGFGEYGGETCRVGLVRAEYISVHG